MAIDLDEHDQKLFERVRKSIEDAYNEAHIRSAVAKKIASRATYFRNKGRLQAIRQHPFKGICEVPGHNGGRLDKNDKHLDEIDPKRGYEGPVRWACPLGNNSGKRRCGES